MKTDTPETDDLARGNHVVPTEWAQQLERERDEARRHLEDIKEYGTEEINAAVELRQKLAAALRERDEEQNRCRKLESALSYSADGQTLLSKFLQAVNDRNRALEQRDDAREILQAVLKNKFGVRCQFIEDEQD